MSFKYNTHSSSRLSLILALTLHLYAGFGSKEFGSKEVLLPGAYASYFSPCAFGSKLPVASRDTLTYKYMKARTTPTFIPARNPTIAGTGSAPCTFRTRTSTRTQTCIWAKQRGNGCDNDSDNYYHDDENHQKKDRMGIVRSLQLSFYKSAAGTFNNTPNHQLEPSTGMLYHLPLWRVPWVEVPGRTNVLNVHEPIYTNMFEGILRSSPPWYVGHMHLSGGSKNLKSKQELHALKSWEEAVPMKSSNHQAVVIGTLLRIADFRRMDDGRLLLLVQAMERFVVVDVAQELPYSAAHVQLLPDLEEVEDSNWVHSRTEGDVAAARGLALAESWYRWHRYEYENTMLPLPLQAELSASEVIGSALARVLPYAPYSSVVDVGRLRAESLPGQTMDTAPVVQDQRQRNSVDYSQNTLEYRLLAGNVLKAMPIADSIQSISCDEIEVRIWLALNDYLKKSQTPVSPVLFGLLPPGMKWPHKFILKNIADAIAGQSEIDHKYIPVSPLYPAHRRQKRLSYCVAALLEDDIDTVTRFRQQLLEIPSTKERLGYLLQKIENECNAFQ